MRLTCVEISESRLRHNIAMVKKFSPDSSIVAMIKANAYGHGIGIYSRILRQESVEYLGVAFLDEAIQLRNFGDNGNIMVLVAADEQEADAYLDYDLESAFSSLDTLKFFSERAKLKNKTIKGHLFIDTGMHRDGIFPKDALNFMQQASKLPNVEIIGICSHLSTADSDDLQFASEQLDLFVDTFVFLESKGFSFKYKHISNSAGLVNLPCKQCNLVRPGISFHGIMSVKHLAEKMNLQSTLSLKSKVQLVKPIAKSETVGYSMKYIAPHDSNVAVVPIGYGDGLLRNLTNRMQCLIRGKRYNQIGSICMDECMFDIGNDNISPNDEVVIIGKQAGEEIEIYELSDLAGTIPYEISTLITERVPRVLVP